MALTALVVRPRRGRGGATPFQVAVLLLHILFITIHVTTVGGDIASQTCLSPLVVGTTSTLTTSVEYVTDVVISPKGNKLYTTGSNYDIIRTVNVTTGSSTILAGVANSAGYRDGSVGTSATNAAFNYPYGLAISSSGSALYIADYNNARIRKIDLVALVVTTIAGGGTGTCVDAVGTAASFLRPSGLALNYNNTLLYIAEQGGHKIRVMVLASGLVTTLVGPPSGTNPSGYVDGIGSAAQFGNLQKIVVSADGQTIYVSDGSNQGTPLARLEGLSMPHILLTSSTSTLHFSPKRYGK